MTGTARFDKSQLICSTDLSMIVNADHHAKEAALSSTTRALFSWDYPAALSGWFEEVVRHYDSLSNRELTEAENAVVTRFNLPSFFVFDQQLQPKWCDDLHRRERLIILHVLDMIPTSLPIHALSASVHGAGLLMPASSGAGKSTLGALLASSGFRVLSDDISWCDPSRVLLPFPRSLSLKSDAIGESSAANSSFSPAAGLTEVFRCEEAIYFRPKHTSSAVETAEAPELRAILFLDAMPKEWDDPVTKISSGEALIRLGEECLDLDIRRETRIRDLCKLIDRTPCFRMSRTDLPEMVDRLQTLAEGLAV